MTMMTDKETKIALLMADGRPRTKTDICNAISRLPFPEVGPNLKSLRKKKLLENTGGGKAQWYASDLLKRLSERMRERKS